MARRPLKADPTAASFQPFKPATERRMFGRRPCLINGWISAAGVVAVRCMLVEHSQDGAFIEMEDVPKLPRLVRLTLNEHRIEIVCLVRHRGPTGIGVKFQWGDVERLQEVFQERAAEAKASVLAKAGDAAAATSSVEPEPPAKKSSDMRKSAEPVDARPAGKPATSDATVAPPVAARVAQPIAMPAAVTPPTPAAAPVSAVKTADATRAPAAKPVLAETPVVVAVKATMPAARSAPVVAAAVRIDGMRQRVAETIGVASEAPKSLAVLRALAAAGIHEKR